MTKQQKAAIIKRHRRGYVVPEKATKDVGVLLEEIERLRDALSFYADPTKHPSYDAYWNDDYPGGISCWSGDAELLIDTGQIAHEALH